MNLTRACRLGIAGSFIMVVTGWPGGAVAATGGAGSEKKATLESVKSDFDEGLGLTLDQKNKIAAIREEFKNRQMAIKNALNAKHEALRQELDGDTPERAKAEPIVVEIKALQGQLTDNRVDVVFKLREIYTPKQIKLIKERSEQQRKTMSMKKQGKKVKKAFIKHKE